MLKPEKISWKDSNLALIGSDLDHKVKAAAADGEPQWDGIGQNVETKVWRIEQFKVVPWPEEKYGSFHTGDSYIVLNSYTVGDEPDIKHDVHIWIGAESSQDEYGTAAYKMVECDEKLGGEPIQHRETQGYESGMFSSYFKQVTYLLGGAESGFNHVEPSVETPFLYRVKKNGKQISSFQMPLSKSSLNIGDSFILFCDDSKVWVWNGSEASPFEKLKAVTEGEKMATGSTVIVLDQGSGDEEDTDFWAYFGDGEIGSSESAEPITEFAPLILQLIPGADAKEVANGELIRRGAQSTGLSKDALNEDDVFLIDLGWELFVWEGKGADKSEKLSALILSDKYAHSNPRTMSLPLTYVKSGKETAAFNKIFE